MKRKYLAILLIILITLSGCGNISSLSTTTATIATTTEASPGLGERGNTLGNLTNGGRYVLAEDGHVYSILKDNDRLYYHAIYKSNQDGTNEVKIFSGGIDRLGSLNVLNGYVYFVDRNDNRSLYKMDTKGNNLQKVCEDTDIQQVIVVDDWIYYSLYFLPGIFKMKIDGSEKTELSHEAAMDLFYYDDWLYYTDYETYKLFKMRLDGSDQSQVDIGPTSETMIYCVLLFEQDWIFYTTTNTETEEAAFYKIKIDGSHKTLLSDHDIRCINTDGEWIYYDDYTEGDYLYKMRLDGSEITFLDNALINTIYVLGDWIRYDAFAADEVYATIQIKKDGSDLRIIQDP